MLNLRATRALVGLLACCAALVLVGCGSSGQTGTREPPVPAHHHHKASGYHGIGATVAAFYAFNKHYRSVGGLPNNLPDYTVTKTAHGRVLAYKIQSNNHPLQSSRDLTTDLMGVNVPEDWSYVINKDDCIVIKSAKLKKLTGYEYAQALGDSTFQTSTMTLVKTASCS